jgi:hypothetical protein
MTSHRVVLTKIAKTEIPGKTIVMIRITEWITADILADLVEDTDLNLE